MQTAHAILRRFAALLVLCLGLAAAPTLYAQDVVILRNGNEFEGRIVEDRDDHLVILVEQPVGRVSLVYENIDSVNGIPAERILGVRAEIEEFLARIQRTRALTTLGAFGKQFLAPRVFIDTLAGEFQQRVKPEAVLPEQQVWQRFQLIPTFLTLYDVLGELQADARTARFLDASRTLTLGVEPSARPQLRDQVETSTTRAVASSPVERALLYHELIHLLQEQNWLAELPAPTLPPSGDERLALEVLREGDANAAMLDFLADDVGARPELLTDVTGLLAAPPHHRAERLATLPPFLRELRVETHEVGLTFARRARQSGGESLIGRIFRDPPVSTEQLLHPERYLVRYDEPVRIGETSLVEPLQSPATQVYSDVWGELRLRLLLQRFLSPEKAAAAAAGWGGDRLTAVERTDTGQILLGWFTAWDEEKDATEFFAAYRGLLEARYGTRLHPGDAPSETLFEGDVVSEDGLWQQRVLIERKGSEVIVVETPHQPSLNAIRELLWGSSRARESAGLHAPLAAGDLPTWTADETARNFWHGPALERAAADIEFSAGSGSVAGGKIRFASAAAWNPRPEGGLVCALESGKAVMTATTFALPFEAPATLIGLWNEGRPAGAGGRRVLRALPGWRLPAGKSEVYIGAEVATDQELGGVARIFRVYAVQGREGVILEVKAPDSQSEFFGPELAAIFAGLRVGDP